MVSYIQVTAPINPGTWGPLVNSKGKVVGVNAAGYLFSQNIGFAIPSRVVLGLVSRLHGVPQSAPPGGAGSKVIHSPTHGVHACSINAHMLHILGMDREKIGKKGVLVVDVSKDSFLGASIKKDDVITHFYIRHLLRGIQLPGPAHLHEQF